MTTFSVVSYLRETRDVVERFAKYYVGLGATEILIYTDGDAGHLAGISAGGLTITECNAAFWADFPGGKPASLEAAQSAAFMAGYKSAKSDWVLIVDADEFVFGDVAMPDFLVSIPPATDVAILPTAEAVWGPGDPAGFSAFSSSYFRLKIPCCAAALSRVLYGRTAGFLHDGILGHARGKQLLRAGKTFDAILNHRTIHDGQRLGTPLTGLYVGHFDAIGLERWQQKWHWRLSGQTNATNMSKRRKIQMAQVGLARGNGDAALHDLFTKWFSLNRFQWRVLKIAGLAFRRDIFDGSKQAGGKTR